MNKLRLSRVVMISAITVIVAFQCYWVNRIYVEEKERIQKQTDVLFKELVYTMQINRFKADTLVYNTGKGNNLFALEAANAFLKERDSVKAKLPKDTGFARLLMKMSKDSGVKFISIAEHTPLDTKRVQFFFDTALPKSSSSIVSIRINATQPNRVFKKGDSAKTVQQWIQQNASEGIIQIKQRNDAVKIIKSPPPIKHPTKFTFNRSFVSLFSRSNAVADSLPMKALDSAYRSNLHKAGIQLSFIIKTGFFDSLHLKDTLSPLVFKTGIATVGFTHPKWYQAGFNNPSSFLMTKILPQAFFSLLLVAFISIAFIFLYRNLVAQQKLATFKNEFISNITHELKTPIATVNVAIEALRSFNALENPERTKEYLAISSAEIQRLSLLVDKVLKLSMFESDKIVLNKEWFNIKQLLQEIIESIKVQFDKKNTEIIFETGLSELFIQADKLHISSVVYNLLDNALKYSGENAKVKFFLNSPLTDVMELRISDNGIGIAQQFQQKIFEKFFRVPTGDIHNIKGYGLGLSYVNHIVRQHSGYIEVKSELGKGSDFTVWLPLTESATSILKMKTT